MTSPPRPQLDEQVFRDSLMDVPDVYIAAKPQYSSNPVSARFFTSKLWCKPSATPIFGKGGGLYPPDFKESHSPIIIK